MNAFKVSAAAWPGFSTSKPAPWGWAIALLLAALVYLAGCDSNNPVDNQASAHPLAGTYALDATYGAWNVNEWQSPPVRVWATSVYITWLISGDVRIENDGAARFSFVLDRVNNAQELLPRETVVYAGRFESAQAGTVGNYIPVQAELHQGGTLLHVVFGHWNTRVFGDTLRYVRVR